MLKGLNNDKLRIKKVNHNGVIFFIQRWTELSYLKTVDSYQYSIMNVYVALCECSDVVEKTIMGIYPTLDHLNDCKKELNRHISDDRVIAKYNKGLYGSIKNIANFKITTKNDENSLSDLKRMSSKLKTTLIILEEKYHEWLETELINSVEHTDYSSIDYLCQVIVSLCIYEGWSVKGLHELSKYLFYKDDPNIESLKKFIKILMAEKSIFDVYFRIDKSLDKESISNWSKMFNIDIEVGAEIISKYDQDIHRYIDVENDGIYYSLKISAKDSYTSALFAIEKCKKLHEMLAFYNKIPLWNFEKESIYVINKGYVKKSSIQDIYATHLYIESSNPIFDLTLQLISDQAFKGNNIQMKLQSVYSYVNISKMAKYQEEKFLNLWIGLESFMNTGQYSNIIAHVKKVLPCVMTRRYLYRIIRNLCEDLLRCGVEIELSGEKIDLEMYDKNNLISRIIKAIRNDVEYQQIKANANVNLLLEYRLECIKQLLSSNNIYDKICRYSETIEWHIQRMYRLRNDITHSGYLLDEDITPYIEHLHDFIAVLMMEVIYSISDFKFDSLGDVLAFLEENYSLYKNKESDNDKIFDFGFISIS